MRILVGFAFALVLCWIAGAFGVNGDQWHWWAQAAFVGAGIVVVVSVMPRAIAPALRRLRSRVIIAAGAAAGSLVLGVSLIFMARHYSDPYSGRLLWPHLLAVFGLAGFALVVVSVAAWAGSAHKHHGRRHF